MSTPDTATSVRKFVLPDPETFFNAQKRNRRATWRMSALCALAALIMGIPLTLVLTPLLYGLALIAADIINYFSPLPAEFWHNASNLANVAYRAADYLINHHGRINISELILAAVLMLAPGMVLALFLWMGMQLLFRHGGVGGTLASLNAREPNQADLKELQLADVVQEMAIAAGLPVPRLMLIDSPGANAAAIGTAAADARIVLSRRLIDDLDRDQMQALLAHLVGSISNGDLRIAFTVTSVFEACGLIITLINAPFGKESRGILWRILRYGFRRSGSDAQSADADEVAELLGSVLDNHETDIDTFFDKQTPGLIPKVLRIILFPFRFTNIAVEMTLWIFLQLLLGPCMALLWRTRRYLADASSVEFTRNPDALATALQQLSEDSNAIAGGQWASHLFVVNPKGDTSLRGAAPQPAEMQKLLDAWRATANSGYVPASAAPEPGSTEWSSARLEMIDTAKAASTGNDAAAARMAAFAKFMGKNPSFGFHPAADPTDLEAASKGDHAAIERLRVSAIARDGKPRPAYARGQTGLQTHSFLSFHPPLGKRAKRLQKMGSHLIAPEKQYSFGLKILMFVLYLIIIPLFTVAGIAMLAAVALMIMLNLMMLGVWLSVIHWAFGQDWAGNYHGFMKFVDRLVKAFK
jgi:Zn-dependent protease with chaperone function